MDTTETRPQPTSLETQIEANNGAAQPSTSGTDQKIARLVALRHRPELLFRHAAALVQENSVLRQGMEEIRAAHEKLRTEIQTLVQFEHYPAVVTAVERNGKTRVRLHIPGMPPVRAEVHPDVPLELIRIGAEGFVSKARNCLLEISQAEPEWPDMGTFEEQLPDGRVVVKHERGTIALIMADSLRSQTLHKGDRIGFREDARVAYARIPASKGEHLFSEAPEDDFAELAGLEPLIRTIQRTIEFNFKFPHVAKRFRLPRKRGILLVGPPGNGKTRIARCTANYIRKLTGKPCRFQSVVGSEDYSMWLGGSESRLKERFAAAREAAKDGPCVMFFDEIDALGRNRSSDYGSSAPGRILSTLLGLMDDVQQTLSNVILIGATNRADSLDPGLTRPGRLDLKLTVPRPNRQAAECILARYLGGRPLPDRNIQDLIAPLLSRLYSPRSEYAELVKVRLNDGRQLNIAAKELISGAMLEHVVRQAAEEAAAREAESGNLDAVTLEDLQLSLDRELLGTAALLSPTNVKSYILSVPQDAHPVEVTYQSGRNRLYIRGA